MCSNSSGEMSFSKLKRIKKGLRSSMSQRRLNHLSLMSIESALLRKQNCCKLILRFACKKAREVPLKFKCLTLWEKLRTFSYSWIYDSKNVFVFALHIYPFHMMLQSVLFRVMNTSIMAAPYDISLHWKDWALEKSIYTVTFPLFRNVVSLTLFWMLDFSLRFLHTWLQIYLCC